MQRRNYGVTVEKREQKHDCQGQLWQLYTDKTILTQWENISGWIFHCFHQRNQYLYFIVLSSYTLFWFLVCKNKSLNEKHSPSGLYGNVFPPQQQWEQYSTHKQEPLLQCSSVPLCRQILSPAFVSSLTVDAAVCGAEMFAAQDGQTQWKMRHEWHPKSPYGFTFSGPAPGETGAQEGDGESKRVVSKNGPPLPHTMKALKKKMEWAAWQLGGDAAIL